jgi:hypothetical protein
MKKVIIFSQAPADLVYVLSLYEKHKSSFEIHIIVVNIIETYEYLNSLKLKAKIDFLPIHNIRKVFNFMYLIFYLRLFYFKNFFKNTTTKIYFFSNYYDYVTFYYIDKLKAKNYIYFCDLYNIKVKEKINFFSKMKSILFFLTFGIRTRIIDINKSYAYQYVLDENINFFNKANINLKLINKYKFNIELKMLDFNKKNIIFMETLSTDNTYISYKKTLTLILSRLTKKYNVIIKGHPRLGFSKFILQHDVHLLDSHTPSELINLDGISHVLCIDSAAISNIEHPSKYCLIDMFALEDISYGDFIKNYLNDLSIEKISYIKDLSEIN